MKARRNLPQNLSEYISSFSDEHVHVTTMLICRSNRRTKRNLPKRLPFETVPIFSEPEKMALNMKEDGPKNEMHSPDAITADIR